MGKPMSKNLLKAGHTLVVFDVAPGPVAELVAAGAARGAAPHLCVARVESAAAGEPLLQHAPRAAAASERGERKAAERARAPLSLGCLHAWRLCVEDGIEAHLGDVEARTHDCLADSAGQDHSVSAARNDADAVLRDALDVLLACKRRDERACVPRVVRHDAQPGTRRRAARERLDGSGLDRDGSPPKDDVIIGELREIFS